MPRIHLKPNSPEFFDLSESDKNDRPCDMPHCDENADFKAPKDRSLGDYYHFCYDHVCEYNRAWNYFSGMSESDIQKQIHNSLYGDRPTWRYDGTADLEDLLREKVRQTYQYGDYTEGKKTGDNEKSSYGHAQDLSPLSPEYKALETMGLAPPLDFEAIKKRYKKLVKKFHPDHNQGCAESEDRLKEINMAYTILKAAHQKYETLQSKS